MSGFAVVPAELQAAEVVLDDAAVSGRAELARLTSAAQGLLRGGWAGEAAAAFTAGWDEWLDGAQQVLRALDDLGGALGAAGRGYHQTDDSVGVDVARTAS